MQGDSYSGFAGRPAIVAARRAPGLWLFTAARPGRQRGLSLKNLVD